MKVVLAVLVSALALGMISLTVNAEEQKCKPGQVYDEAQGKCVTPRGS